jgi:hypothetical protein
MLITFDGATATNQLLSPLVSHLELSHPSMTDRLLLAECDDRPYEHFATGWQNADGRSVLGAIRVKGGDWRKDVWQGNFLVGADQKVFFDGLLLAQQTTTAAVVLIDRFFDTAITRSVWINVDRQYLTVVGLGWWRLQFELWEV